MFIEIVFGITAIKLLRLELKSALRLAVSAFPLKDVNW